MSFKSVMSKIGFWTKKHAPEIMLVTGLASMAAGTAFAIKNTPTVKIKLDDIKAKLQDPTLAENETQEERDKSLKKEAVKTVVKYYWAPALAYVGGTALVVGSHCVLKKRLAVTGASLAAVTSALATYKANARKTLDKETIQKIESQEVVNPETGEITTSEINPNDITEYTFSKETSIFWDPRMWNNAAFLRCKEDYLTAVLEADGHLFLNTVLRELGMKETDEGQYLGWIYDPKDPYKDNRILFGPHYEQADDDATYIKLEFNFDGNILAMPDWNEKKR